jgi:hypothetical protein
MRRQTAVATCRSLLLESLGQFPSLKAPVLIVQVRLG